VDQLQRGQIVGDRRCHIRHPGGACPTVRKHIGAISDKTGRAAEVLNSPLGSLRSIVSLSGADGPQSERCMRVQ